MDAEIISIGTEITLGQIVNTNAPFLARRLSTLNIEVQRLLTVPDQLDLLEKVVRAAWQKSKLVFVCGGLGPTADDITLRGVAAALQTTTQLDHDRWSWIKQDFKQRQKAMMPENIRQAKYLAGGQPLANPVGLALGSWYAHNGHRLVVLPGPPREFKAMVDQEVMPRLRSLANTTKQIVSRTLNFFGRPESQLMDEIANVTKNLNQIVITSYVQPVAIQVRLTVHDRSVTAANRLLDRAQQAIIDKESDYYFGHGDDCSLAVIVVHLLKKQGLKVTAAESLTGGMFQSIICSVPGASNVFDGGFVTYAASAKENLLGIDHQLIEQYGVVSAQTAAQMAERSRRQMNVDVGIGFTGVAGPDTLEGQPAGTVWVGLAVPGRKTITQQLHLGTHVGRQEIRRQSVQYGLQMIYLALKK